MNNLKDTILTLAGEVLNGNKKSEIALDSILSEAFNISYLTLFLKRISKKDCVITISKLVSGIEVSDIEVSKALSSLLTHSLIELEKDDSKFFELRIVEQSLVLNKYLSGEASTEDVIAMYKPYL